MNGDADNSDGADGACGSTTYRRQSNRPKPPDTLTHARLAVRLASGKVMPVLTDQCHGYVRARIWHSGPCGCGNTEVEAVDDLLKVYPGATREDASP